MTYQIKGSFGLLIGAFILSSPSVFPATAQAENGYWYFPKKCECHVERFLGYDESGTPLWRSLTNVSGVQFDIEGEDGKELCARTINNSPPGGPPPGPGQPPAP